MHRIVVFAVSLLLVSGCATLGYYGQAIGGHLSILGRARPIDELLADPNTTADTRDKLARVVAMRAFASHALALPDNASYRRYADIERPYVVWNVFATPELSLKPKEWCFLVAGCVAYRGYFDRDDAERDARELHAEGHDVHVAGVTAYSTLGWFDDPLMNTMIGRPEPELAGLIFHELAHQKLYVADDTAFNESFAMVVEREGVRRWLATHGADGDYTAYLGRQRRREEFVQLTQRARQQLDSLYRSTQPDDAKRASKQEIFAALRHDYEQLKKSWNGFTGFDAWMTDVNNAKFVSIGLYHDHLAAFEALLARHGNDLAAFYRAVERLAHEPKQLRIQKLALLTATEVSTTPPSSYAKTSK
jgi:predicted aminopeptidase